MHLEDNHEEVEAVISNMSWALRKTYDYLWICDYVEAAKILHKSLAEVPKELRQRLEEARPIVEALHSILAKAKKLEPPGEEEAKERVFELRKETPEKYQQLYRALGERLRTDSPSQALTLFLLYHRIKSLTKLLPPITHERSLLSFLPGKEEEQPYTGHKKLDRLRCYLECFDELYTCEARCIFTENVLEISPEKEAEIDKTLKARLSDLLDGQKTTIKVSSVANHTLDIYLWQDKIMQRIHIYYNRIRSILIGPSPRDAKIEVFRTLKLISELLEELKLLMQK